MATINWKKTSVLVIDDEPMIRQLIETILRHIGVKVVYTADNGARALSLLNTIAYLPDVIICDMQMPEMNGLEFIANLRKAGNAMIGEIPVLACTTVSKKDVVQEAARLGVNDFIVKPIAPDDLKVRVETVLGKAKDKKTQK